MKYIRIFIGLTFTDNDVAALLELQQQLKPKLSERSNWYSAEKLHLTLRFLGNVRVKTTFNLC